MKNYPVTESAYHCCFTGPYPKQAGQYPTQQQTAYPTQVPPMQCGGSYVPAQIPPAGQFLYGAPPPPYNATPSAPPSHGYAMQVCLGAG